MAGQGASGLVQGLALCSKQRQWHKSGEAQSALAVTPVYVYTLLLARTGRGALQTPEACSSKKSTRKRKEGRGGGRGGRGAGEVTGQTRCARALKCPTLTTVSAAEESKPLLPLRPAQSSSSIQARAASQPSKRTLPGCSAVRGWLLSGCCCCACMAWPPPGRGRAGDGREAQAARRCALRYAARASRASAPSAAASAANRSNGVLIAPPSRHASTRLHAPMLSPQRSDMARSPPPPPPPPPRLRIHSLHCAYSTTPPSPRKRPKTDAASSCCTSGLAAVAASLKAAASRRGCASSPRSCATPARRSCATLCTPSARSMTPSVRDTPSHASSCCRSCSGATARPSASAALCASQR